MPTGKLCETCREEIIILLYKHFQKTRTVGILFNSSSEVNISLQSGKNIPKKQKDKSISVMNINAKQINKMFANQSIERIINHNHIAFILGMNGWFKFKY